MPHPSGPVHSGYTRAELLASTLTPMRVAEGTGWLRGFGLGFLAGLVIGLTAAAIMLGAALP